MCFAILYLYCLNNFNYYFLLIILCKKYIYFNNVLFYVVLKNVLIQFKPLYKTNFALGLFKRDKGHIVLFNNITLIYNNFTIFNSVLIKKCLVSLKRKQRNFQYSVL